MSNSKLVLEAAVTAHDACGTQPQCPHASALVELYPVAVAMIKEAAEEEAKINGTEPDYLGFMFNHAFHIGYRLHQLEQSEAKASLEAHWNDKKGVN